MNLLHVVVGLPKNNTLVKLEDLLDSSLEWVKRPLYFLLRRVCKHWQTVVTGRLEFACEKCSPCNTTFGDTKKQIETLGFSKILRSRILYYFSFVSGIAKICQLKIYIEKYIYFNKILGFNVAFVGLSLTSLLGLIIGTTLFWQWHEGLRRQLSHLNMQKTSIHLWFKVTEVLTLS